MNVARDEASIDVNGKLYPVKTGDVFPSDTTGPFKVLRLGKLDSGRGARRCCSAATYPSSSSRAIQSPSAIPDPCQ